MPKCRGFGAKVGLFFSFSQKRRRQLGLGVVVSGAGADGAAGAEEALPPRILNITVPHVGHLPLMALRPFFIVSSTASTISFLAVHLTQYPSGINFFRTGATCDGAVIKEA
jgi:hypothetical protein